MARKRSAIRNNNIPQEIIMEILYRLPAKSVGRFRCVSKAWLSLLTDPAFLKTHQNTINGNRLIIFKSLDSHGSLCSLPFDQNHIELKARVSRPKVYTPFDSDEFGLDVIGCCNGLLLLSAFSYCEHRLTVSNHRLIVLNPTTKDFLELPVCNCCFDPDDAHIFRFKQYFLYGFSYDSCTHDYKVVTIFFKTQGSFFSVVPAVHVYSLRTNTWKHVTDFPYEPFHPGMGSSSAFANGNIHRLARKGSAGYSPEIVAFSLAGESFSEVPSPPDNILASGYCELVNLGGKLGIFREVDGDVWLMNEYGVKESWTNISLHGIYKVPRSIGGEPTLFHKDDDDGCSLLLVVRHDQLLIYDIEGKGFCKYSKATSHLGKDLIAKAICVDSLVSPNNYGLTD